MFVKRSEYSRIVLENAELKSKNQGLENDLNDTADRAAKRWVRIQELEVDNKIQAATIKRLTRVRNNKGQFIKN